jgi:glycosyltransferase involved in cell wall biosynthesis
MANSRFVSERIVSSYGKGSLVVHPPIDTTFWCPGRDDDAGGYFLLGGRMVAYKRPDIVIDAATRAGVPLVVAGSGPLLKELRKRASPSVRFEENPSRERLRDLYRGAHAFVFAGVEDFGMSIVEAQACGTPVIALAAGGALETVLGGRTGVLVKDATSAAFARSMSRFRPEDFDPQVIRENALRFDIAKFDQLVTWAVDQALKGQWAELALHPAWVPGPST